MAGRGIGIICGKLIVEGGESNLKNTQVKYLAKVFALWSAAIMLILGILGNMGMYLGAVQAMQRWHMFFSLSLVGIVGGMIEAAVLSYVLVYLFAWIYNKVK